MRTQYIKAIADNLNIDTSNIINLDLIADCIENIDNNSLRAFMKHLATNKYQFSKPFEKLGQASNDFLQNLKDEAFSDIEDKVELLLRKIRSCEKSILSTMKKGQNYKSVVNKLDFNSFQVNEKSYFDKKEIEILNEAGGLSKALSDFDSSYYFDKLVLVVRNFRTKAYFTKSNGIEIEHKTNNNMLQLVRNKVVA